MDFSSNFLKHFKFGYKVRLSCAEIICSPFVLVMCSTVVGPYYTQLSIEVQPLPQLSKVI